MGAFKVSFCTSFQQFYNDMFSYSFLMFFVLMNVQFLLRLEMWGLLFLQACIFFSLLFLYFWGTNYSHTRPLEIVSLITIFFSIFLFSFYPCVLLCIVSIAKSSSTLVFLQCLIWCWSHTVYIFYFKHFIFHPLDFILDLLTSSMSHHNFLNIE